MSVESAELPAPSSANPLLFSLQQALASCSRSIQGGDLSVSQAAASELVVFLDSVSDAAVSQPENEDAKNNALAILTEVYNYLSSPSVDQAILDALSFELPKAISKFAAVSSSCMEVADRVIDRFIETCTPRDMLSILCEALDSTVEGIEVSAYVSPLLGGLSKVFLAIRRRYFEQVKAVVPVIFKVLKSISTDDEDAALNSFDRAIEIANSIHAVSVELEGGANEKLSALLGLYVLQIVALVSLNTGKKLPHCNTLAVKLAHFIPNCYLSYRGLITGSDVDTMTNAVAGEDEDDYTSCLPHVNLGAALSVIWGQISDEVALVAKEDLSALTVELRRNQTKRWEAISMLKHIFSSVDLLWEFKRHAMEFLLRITHEKTSKNLDEHVDCSHYMTSLFSALQSIIMIIIHAPDSILRKNAFLAFKRVLADVPASQKFDIFAALVAKTDSSSMIAIILDLVRGEMCVRCSQKTPKETNELQDPDNYAQQSELYWSPSVLELVKLVLRPPKGGPPALPEHGDAVLSALNLYRFILMTESTGNTNYTGVLSRNNLRMVYNEWLLPLRTLVSGITAENKSDNDQFSHDTALECDVICSPCVSRNYTRHTASSRRSSFQPHRYARDGLLQAQ